MEQTLQECLRPFFLWMGEDIFGISFLHDIALIHENDVIGNASGKLHLVRDDGHGHAG